MSQSGEAWVWNSFSHLLTGVIGALVQIALLPGPSVSPSVERNQLCG